MVIDVKPSSINYTDWLEEPYRANHTIAPTLHDTPPVRQSQVLGPDGEPVSVDMPRRRIGFDLTANRETD